MERVMHLVLVWNQQKKKKLRCFVGFLLRQDTMFTAACRTIPTRNEKNKLQANLRSYDIGGNVRALCAEGRLKEALDILQVMDQRGIRVDSRTYASLLQECINTNAVEEGKRVHVHMINTGFEPDVYLRTKLVIMYAKRGSLEYARHMFDKMSERNVVSWNAMIAGYAQGGHAEEALSLFYQMRGAGMKPDQFTFPSILRACASIVSLEQGKQVHACIVKGENSSNIVLGSALVDMYAKCGSIEDARQVFDKMSERNVVSWTAIITGYGKHGRGKEVFQLFEQMQQEGLKPNYVTFLAILSACSHGGLLNEAWHYFESMSRDYCIKPRVEHYSCIVDLLGRAGRLDEAHDFINKMPFEPHAPIWGTLLGACRMHVNMELGKIAAERLFYLDPQNAGKYVVLSNIYAAAGRWDGVSKVRKLMKDRGVKKEPGCSWIEIQKQVHSFLVGDRSHPQTEEIYATLETLSGKLKEAGYVPETNFMLHDVEEEQKERFLCYHSEKLAIAFGIISLPSTMPIRIVKNLRVCGDCHTAIKFISRIVGREIILRDSNRFHHFKWGLCSCGDYW
eukprot:Gb_32051 [translate_table: standard]